MKIEMFGIAREMAVALVKGVADGQYSLLTGAGFSIGARGKGGEVPSAKACAEALNKKFGLGLTVSSAADLPIAYEDALDSPSAPDAVNELFERLFTGCKPSWQKTVEQFDWKRVWTLNVDDLPEAIWSTTSRRVSHIDFGDRYRPIDHSQDELQVVYLHGRAAIKKKAKSRYVFSISEYVDATKDAQAWHTAFFTEFSDRPFIVCGASAVGEFDLAKTFRSGSQSVISTGLPSVAVIKDLDEPSANRFRNRLKLIPLNIDGKSFFDALAEDVTSYRAANPTVVSLKASAADARVFGSQFRALTEVSSPPRNQRHDFHLGDEPVWHDIRTASDARLSFASKATEFIKAQIESGENPVVTIIGDPGCGKTTTLLRILDDCRVFSDLTFFYRGEEGISVQSALNCMSTKFPSVIGFDLAADFSVDIAALVRGAKERKLPVAIVLADRLRRKKGLLSDIRASSSLLIDHSKLSGGDALQVYDARKRQHRLGGYLAKPASDMRKLIVQKHDGNLFSALAEVEGGRGFYQRLDDHVRIVDSDYRFRQLAHGVCLTHRWGYPLPLRCASIVSEMGVATLVDACVDAGVLADVFVVEQKGVRFRHRALADHYFDQFADREVLYQAAKAVVESLAPLVTVDAIRSKSYPYLICRVLMERRSISASVGSISRARDFFGDLEGAFGGNSRFWEQRALLESEAGNHSKAYSYAHEAVSRERHTFPLTTLGRVCMAQALDLASSSPAGALGKFKEGAAALLEARAVGSHRPDTLGHPFTCFFDYATRFYPVAEQVPGATAELKLMWESWSMDAGATKVFGDSGDLDMYRGKWMKAVLASRSIGN